MEKRYYNVASLDRAVRELEREYGMTTAVFYQRYRAGEPMDVPHFSQHTWASFHEDVLRLNGDEPIEQPPVIDRVGEALTCI